MEVALKNLNTLPVITWRWLKVNDLSLSYALPKIGTYHREVIKYEGEKILVTQDSSKPEFKNSIMDNGLSYGVSDELIEVAKNGYNSSLFIQSEKRVKEEEIIKIDYTMDDENLNLVDNNIIIANENSKMTIIMEYKTDGDVEAFHNGITRIYAKDGSEVTVIKVQMMNSKSHHFDSNVAFIGYGAKVNFISVELGGKFSISNYVSNLDNTSASSDLKSIYFGDKDRIIDLSYKMNHNAMRTESNIETKGALKDKSRKIFRGTLDFKKGSKLSKGAEEEYATLLNSGVKSDAIPLLLCDEDDVVGAHAASAGKIDEDKLFYIMSRGFNEIEAKKLIVEATFKPIIDAIPDEVTRTIIEDEIQRRLLSV